MSSRSIHVVVGKRGETRVEAMNFQGQGCAALTNAMASALGTTTHAEPKAEFYQQLPAMPAVVQLHERAE